ncbi:MAG: hypothetical protein JRG91_12410 [Deltaproteobacteria bacterium]|nr:hypothetical protein [Deltaproteobacteria bacterium]
MGSSGFPAAVRLACLALALAPGTAGAQHGHKVLLFCDEVQLGTGPGACESMHLALEGELSDFDLHIMLMPDAPVQTAPTGMVPGLIAARTVELGALFSVWFSRTGAAQDVLLTMHVYDPAVVQIISRTLQSSDASGAIDDADVAFHIRIIMGASLYSDIEQIVDEEGLMDLAIPDERRSAVAAPAMMRLDVGYLLSGYPTRNHWYHGFVFDVAFLPMKRLEIFTDVAVAFRQSPVTVTYPTYAHLRNTQILIGVGVRYDILAHERVAILPVAGLHLGLSNTTVTMRSVEKYLRLHPAVWAGVDVRIAIVERVAIAVGVSFENLFRRERFILENTVIFEISQFRFGAALMLCFSI